MDKSRSFSLRRTLALIRLARIKVRDIIFIGRYAAHLVILLLTIAVGMVHTSDLYAYLNPAENKIENTSVMLWETTHEDNNIFLSWETLPETIIPERPAAPRLETIVYQVRAGDNPAVIAKRFGLQPSTIIWSNSAMEENPNLLNIGETLLIPPIDGVLHIVKPGDSLEAIASKYQADEQSIRAYSANQVVSHNNGEPLVVGQQIVVPNGIQPSPTPLPTETPLPTATPYPTSTPYPTTISYPTSIPFYPTSTPYPTNTPYPTSIPYPTVTPTQQPQSYTTTSNNNNTTNNNSTTSNNSNTNSNSSSIYQGSTGCCRWPVSGRITSGATQWHMALDIATSLGTPVVAADGGRVIAVGWDNSGYGYRVIIDHGGGIRTLYAHLSRYTVDYGEYVNKGQMIGRVGSTGQSTGPHLHFEVRRYNYRINPWDWLP